MGYSAGLTLVLSVSLAAGALFGHRQRILLCLWLWGFPDLAVISFKIYAIYLTLGHSLACAQIWDMRMSRNAVFRSITRLTFCVWQRNVPRPAPSVDQVTSLAQHSRMCLWNMMSTSSDPHSIMQSFKTSLYSNTPSLYLFTYLCDTEARYKASIGGNGECYHACNDGACVFVSVCMYTKCHCLCQHRWNILSGRRWSWQSVRALKSKKRSRYSAFSFKATGAL